MEGDSHAVCELKNHRLAMIVEWFHSMFSAHETLIFNLNDKVKVLGKEKEELCEELAVQKAENEDLRALLIVFKEDLYEKEQELKRCESFFMILGR